MATLTEPLVKARASGHMTAAVLHGSENLKIESIDIPQLAADEALLRVKVALTCGTDLKVWKRGYHARDDHASGGVRARARRCRRTIGS